MAGSTVRLSEAARTCLRRMAKAEKTSMQTLVEKALEDYRRRRFLLGVNAAYGKLREGPEAWEEVREEREAWDATLQDGLYPVLNRKSLQPKEPRARPG